MKMDFQALGVFVVGGGLDVGAVGKFQRFVHASDCNALVKCIQYNSVMSIKYPYRINEVADLLGIDPGGIRKINSKYLPPFVATENSTPENVEISTSRHFLRSVSRILLDSPHMPLVPLATISSFLGAPEKALVSILTNKKYVVLDVPHIGRCLRFGDALYITKDIKVLKSILTRLDRGALLWWIWAKENIGPVMLPMYSNNLESAIRRIARLKSPWRVYAAGDLLEKYMEAKYVSEAVKKKTIRREQHKSDPFGTLPSVERIHQEFQKLADVLDLFPSNEKIASRLLAARQAKQAKREKREDNTFGGTAKRIMQAAPDTLWSAQLLYKTMLAANYPFRKGASSSINSLSARLQESMKKGEIVRVSTKGCFTKPAEYHWNQSGSSAR